MQGVTGWLGAGGYEFSRQVLQRGIAAIFVVAFLSAVAQFPALLGEHGLLPAPTFLARAPRRSYPSLFHWRYSDNLLLGVAWTGAVLAFALVLGLPQAGPPWIPLVVFLFIWALYLSIVSIGQTFYGFGWESLLLEAGFIAAFLGSDSIAPPVTILWLLRWLVFRLEFGAGMIKIRGDTAWRDLTALYYHHETQPMPNPLSRYFHHLPKPLHRFEVMGNHFAQLIVPFFLFAPQPLANIAAAIVVLTQAWLVLSGNFAWLNVLAMILAFSAISNDAVHRVIPAVPAGTAESAQLPGWFAVVVLAATVWLIVLSYKPLRNLFSRHQLMNASFNRWHLVNAYGAFGSITRERYEVIVEGTDDDDPDEARWREYEFRGKPGDPGRRPRQYAPYHLRLGWMLWFMALGSPSDYWFVPLLGKLLTADRRTLKLLRSDPFDGAAPRWIRARLFSYRFSTRAERKATGMEWVREPAAMLVAPVSLRRS